MRITNYTRVKNETIMKAIEDGFCDVGKYRYFVEHYATFRKVVRTEKKLLGTTAALDNRELVAVVHL